MNEDQNTPENSSISALPYRRRVKNILIHKPMQREFTMVLIGLLMISTFAVAYVIHGTIHELSAGGAYNFGKISVYEILSDLSYQLVIRICGILFVTLVVMGTYGIFFLHRVAGPVYRFRNAFLRLNDGEIPKPIQLREGDFFAETAIEINRLINKIKFDREQLCKAKEKTRQICSAHPNEPAAKELKAILERECDQ